MSRAKGNDTFRQYINRFLNYFPLIERQYSLNTTYHWKQWNNNSWNFFTTTLRQWCCVFIHSAHFCLIGNYITSFHILLLYLYVKYSFHVKILRPDTLTRNVFIKKKSVKVILKIQLCTFVAWYRLWIYLIYIGSCSCITNRSIYLDYLYLMIYIE